MYRKGQLSSLDFIGSVVVFVLLLTGIIFFWNIYTLRFNAQLERDALTFQLVKISDLLVEHPGIPTHWNETNVEVIGLVSSDRKLHADKLSAFMNITYNKTKTLLNIDQYDFYFRIVDLNGAFIKANGQFIEKGAFPSTTEDSIITIRRIALYGTQKAVLELSAWK